MAKKRKNKRIPAPNDELDRYALKPLKHDLDYSLERQAIQQIVDSVIKLQTYKRAGFLGTPVRPMIVVGR